ncbi:MAG: DUF2442 domain-containing protein [Cyclobacteriaceae bacterium]|jgi:hypothetical protein|nr:DUF2442 domain-containing protein [Cyclobacteriaceae bacterium]
MRKIIDIEPLESFHLLCVFENGERKVLNLNEALDKSNKYVSKILTKEIFTQAKVGALGQIYWDGIAEIKNLEGKWEPCEYDISPDFAYFHSSASTSEVDLY